jgi:uncharacterized protein YceK
MKKLSIVLIVLLLLSACGKHNYHTVEAKKPRYHKGWYKNSRFHTKLRVGRIHIRWFEKQGTKTVKMKG